MRDAFSRKDTLHLMNTERVAVVVGAASGIGWATAKALAADGCRVIVADRNTDGANDRAAELGSPHTAAYVDVTDEGSVQRLFDDAGPVDVVVSCAGFSNVGLITDMPVDQFRAVVDVCLTGAFIVAKHAGQRLGEDGVLVSISSLTDAAAVQATVDDVVARAGRLDLSPASGRCPSSTMPASHGAATPSC